MPSTNSTISMGPVVSWRVNWGAIFAGAFVFLSLFLLVGSLVAAIGLSGGGRIGTGTWIVEALVLLGSLFVGGWVTGQWIEGETVMEGLLNGSVLWGLLFVALMTVSLSAVRAGVGFALGVSNVASSTLSSVLTPAELARVRRDLGLTDAQFAKLQASLHGAGVGPVNIGPAAWWSFFGILISMVFTLAGSIAGSRTSVVAAGAGPVRRIPPAQAA